MSESIFNFTKQACLLSFLKGTLLIVLAFGFIPDLHSQDSDDSGPVIHNQLWLDFYPHFYFTEKLEYYGDLGFRTVVNDDIWRRVYFRPSVRYHYTDYIQFRGGIGSFFIGNKSQPNSFELSPWQGVNARWPRFSQLRFDHLIRFEERSIWQLGDESSYDFELRFRYKITGSVLFCKPCGDQYWSMPFYTELFVPLTNEAHQAFRNRGRAGIGVAYKQSRKWQYDLIFTFQRSRNNPSENLEVSDRILQFKVRRLMK